MSLPTPSSADPIAIEVDQSNDQEWAELCRGFSDNTIYQSRAYGVARSGRSNVSHLVLKRGPDALAACHVRIASAPLLPTGVAYVRWGPMWRRGGAAEANLDTFREILRALRAEYVVRRKLVLRILPHLFDRDRQSFEPLLQQEGFVLQRRAREDRTILVDLAPPLDELHRGLHQKWRYNLNKARKQKLEITQGTDDSFFEEFGRIYGEMVDRKQLMSGSELDHFRQAQKELPPAERLQVILCRSEGQVCAGAVCSALGDTGIYLLGATSNRGIKTFGSYLVHWTMLEWMKQQGCRWYDLNGINPVHNPGGYQFKLQLAGSFGQDLRFLGQYDAYPHLLSRWLVNGAELIRSKLKRK